MPTVWGRRGLIECILQAQDKVSYRGMGNWDSPQGPVFSPQEIENNKAKKIWERNALNSALR